MTRPFPQLCRTQSRLPEARASNAADSCAASHNRLTFRPVRLEADSSLKSKRPHRVCGSRAASPVPSANAGLVALAKEIRGRGGRVSLRDVAKALEAQSHVTPSGK